MSFLCKIARRVPVFKEVISGLIQQKNAYSFTIPFSIKSKKLTRQLNEFDLKQSLNISQKNIFFKRKF